MIQSPQLYNPYIFTLDHFSCPLSIEDENFFISWGGNYLNFTFWFQVLIHHPELSIVFLQCFDSFWLELSDSSVLAIITAHNCLNTWEIPSIRYSFHFHQCNFAMVKTLTAWLGLEQCSILNSVLNWCWYLHCQSLAGALVPELCSRVFFPRLAQNVLSMISWKTDPEVEICISDLVGLILPELTPLSTGTKDGANGKMWMWSPNNRIFS